MKKLCFILFILSLFILGNCSKDKAIPKAIQAPDTIAYHDIADTTIYSTGPLVIPGFYYWPRDSSCSFPLDVNQDGIIDFNLFSSNNYIPIGGPTESNREIKCVRFSCVNSYDGAICYTYSAPAVIAQIDSTGDVINGAVNYNSSPYIYYLYPGFGLWGINYTDKYIGFKIVRNSNNYFGWILFSNIENKVTLKSWALNKTANNSIIAGQTH